MDTPPSCSGSAPAAAASSPPPRLAWISRLWRRPSAATRDMLLIGLSCIVMSAIATRQEVFQVLHQLSHGHPGWLLGNLVAMAFIAPLGLAFYALRRQRELRHMVASRTAAQAEAQPLAFHEPLTGLPNPHLQRDRDEVMLAREGEIMLAQLRRREAQVALMMVDLDPFKPANDLHGYPAGDVVLREVALRLRDCVREGDIVARTGGGEFVVMAEVKAGAEDAARLARRIIATIGQPITLGRQTTKVGASLGIALADGKSAGTFGTLLQQADAATCRARSEGRGTFKFHEAGMDATG